MAPTNPARTFPFGLIAILIAVIAALWAGDLLLARVDNKETTIQARHYFESGTRFPPGQSRSRRH